MFPDLDAVVGADGLESIVGALLAVVLVVAVLMVVVCAVGWAVGSSSGNLQVAARGRVGTLVSAGTAALAGASTALLNFLLDLGHRL